MIILSVKKIQSLSFDIWSRDKTSWGFKEYIEVYFLKVWALEHNVWVGKMPGSKWVYKVKKCQKVESFEKIEIFCVSFIIFGDIWSMWIKKIF